MTADKDMNPVVNSTDVSATAEGGADLPDLVPGTLVRRIVGMRGDGYWIVECMDGSSAKVAQEDGKPSEEDRCTKKALQDWLSRFEGPEDQRRWGALYQFYELMLSDKRLDEYWNWLQGVRFTRVPSLKNVTTIGETIWRATRFPGKPGNMTPANRDAYFRKIRSHAAGLMELLDQTRFDVECPRELTERELEKTLGDTLYDWGDDEALEGHVVAYLVTPDGRFSLHYDYPESALKETLGRLIDWTYWDDHWDGNILKSSGPISQVGSQGARIVYFSCSVYDWFDGHGVQMPFPILATLANVALKLPPDQQADEDRVKKQVRRYRARKKPSLEKSENAFDG